MLGDYGDSRPFWFADPELLTEVSHAEVAAIMQLFAKYPDLGKFFDAPEATIPQRTACFKVLAHCKVIETIEENFLGFYLDPPTLSEEESNAYKRALTLVRSDAPSWVVEMNEVAEWFPTCINTALPEPLREGRYTNDPVKDEFICSSARTLSTVEQIQALTARVFNAQLQRLRERWSAAVGQPGGPKKPKHWSKGIKGLGPKVTDLSQYMHLLTDKQWMALSLKLEYGLGPVEIASRMGIDRKTVSEHLAAADKRIREAYSSERHKAVRAKNEPD